MARSNQAAKHVRDLYAQRGKTLTSSVQRLRGWVGSDPSRAPELADALVELTAHRLLGHAYPAAAADAQEAVRRSAELLTADGPIGPYTSREHAVRYATALVHLAGVQVGVGLPDAAGRTLASLDDTVSELGNLALDQQLGHLTVVWSLSARARAALAAGEVAAANSYADAVLSRTARSGLRTDPDAEYVPVDADRLASDARWAAGRGAEALEFLHSAKDRYDSVVDGRLHEPGRLNQALTERLSEPLFGLYRDLADRLAASGEVDLALLNRRTLVDLLRELAGRIGDPATRQLASALNDLAGDLLEAGRVEEAEASNAEAAAILLGRPGTESTQILVAAVKADVGTRTGRTAEAVERLRRLLPHPLSAATSAAQAVGLLALADALRVEDSQDAAAVQAIFDSLAERLVGPGTPTRAKVRELARGVVSRGERSEPGAEAADEAASAWLEAERAEAHRLELERQEQARLQHERREAERLAAEQAEARREAATRVEAAAAQRLEAERRAAAEEAEREERKRRREERLAEHRREVEEREAAEAERRESERSETERAELADAQEEWQQASARGDRRAARVALERVVELLRLRAQTDLGVYGPRLQSALEELSSARLRSGDVWGSRAPAKEAKALAKALGR